jgi:MSHA biogenesis protein MshQ
VLFEPSTGHLIAWVSLPSLSSSTDIDFYLYYGHPTAGNQEDVEAVWDSSYVFVQHLDETSGTHADSTQYGNDGSPQNGVIQNATGIIAGADQFDGSDDFIQVADSSSLQLNDHSIEMWFQRSETGTDEQMLVEKRDASNQSNYFIALNKYGNQEIFPGFSDGTDWYSLQSNFPLIGDTSWHHLVYTFDSTGQVQRVYLDGIDEGTNTSISATPATGGGQILYIGRDSQGGRAFQGLIDEVRISSLARSAAWVATSYTNQSDPGTFIQVGDEEEEPTGIVISALSATSCDNHILVSWETLLELNILGFNIYRSETLYGEPTQLNQELIPSQALGNITGSHYEYVDSTAQPGVTYYYWLEIVGIDEVSRMGPVTATALFPLFIPIVVR